MKEEKKSGNEARGHTPSLRDQRATLPRVRTRAVLTLLSAAVAVISGLTIVAAQPASASTVNGVATITNSDGTGTFVPSGASTTPFTVTLPANASCSGDTANDGFHVYSYLVPKGTDVTTLTFSGSNPPSQSFGFLNNAGVYYGPVNTAVTTGQIISIPNNFEWAPFATDNLVPTLLAGGTTPGTWEAGLLCSNSTGAVTDNWNTEITFSANVSDPNGFVWSGVPGPSGNQLPVITSANSASFIDGTSNTFTPTATGTPSPTITESGTLPSGVTFSGGVLAGTPTASGSFPITFTATNGIGNPAVQNFTLTVGAAQVAPTITSANSTGFTVGTPGTFTVTATGTPSPTFSETGTLPTGVTFTGGVLSGTPGAGTAGNYPLTITATNGVNPDATQSFTLTVGSAPAITSANHATFTVGSAGTFTPTATGTPAPAISESGILPTGVTFSGGVLSGTPGAGTSGSYSITLTATNGITPDATQSFTLTVDGPPTITSANSTSFVVGTAGTFTVTATGFPAPTFGESGTLPTGVTFSAGILSGTPGAGTAGNYPLTITATNGVSPDATQSFSLHVGLPPAITSVNHTTFTVGTAGTFTATATGTPIPTLSESGTLPSGVTFTSGVLSGTAAAGTGGTYPITITAANGVGSNATQPFTLTVDAPPAIISANATTFSVGTAGSFTATATGFPAPTFSESGTLPTGVALTSSGVLSGTPAAGRQGTYPITITATNGITPDATQSFTITVVIPPLVISTASLPSGTAGTPYTATLAATGGTSPYSWAILAGSLPAGLTLNAATGTISGTPTTVATSAFTVTVIDVDSAATTKALSIAVASSVIPPNAGSLSGPVVAIAPTPDGKGYWLVNAFGDISPHGSAQGYGSLVGMALGAPIVAMAPTPDGKGYWLVASDGGVFSFGDATFHGSMGGQHLNAPVVGVAATASGQGYWLVASDGGIFSFGDATFDGSMGGQHLNRAIVGMTADAGSGGYWLVASDGGVFSFGNAVFHGSTGGQHLNRPIVGMAADPGSGGYWLVASDGGVFSFGDAVFHGSGAAIPVAGSVTGMAVSSSAPGYWLASNGGGVYTFGPSFYGAD